MRPFAALYLKEWKDSKNLFLFLLIGTVALEAWVLLAVDTRILAAFLCGLPVWVFMVILPFMLASSFSSEWKSNTHHLLLSLPVRTSIVGLCKYLTIFSMGTVLFGVAYTAVYLALLRAPDPALEQIPKSMGLTTSMGLAYAVGIYFSYLFLLLGIVSGMEGVKFTVKRFGGIVSVGFFLVGFFVYVALRSRFSAALMGFHMGDGLTLTVYSILAGLAFLGLGLFLFEKYVEV